MKPTTTVTITITKEAESKIKTLIDATGGKVATFGGEFVELAAKLKYDQLRTVKNLMRELSTQQPQS
jgi:uncharacterized protein YajQ (UPF0234 family)